ncbi:MAG TPA: hypothetical protein VIL48_08755 [Acidimicrobiales bacterium]
MALEVRADGRRRPVGSGVVTGGDALRPFTGEVRFRTPRARLGAVALATHSAGDGRAWEAAVRVRFR